MINLDADVDVNTNASVTYALFAKEREDSLDITEQILRSGALEPEDADFVYNFSSCTSEVEDAMDTSQQFTWYSIFRNGI